MVISGKTLVSVNGKTARILSKTWNEALRKDMDALVVCDAETGAVLVPSKGLGWQDVSHSVRLGKKVQARCETVKGVVRGSAVVSK